MKILSVVCARAGSKGLQNKCIKKICGRMVAEYAIEYSLALGLNVDTIVSTDIQELIDYCSVRDIKYIRRDANLCGDSCRIEDALADSIERNGSLHDYCSLVYGNIPTRYPELFSEALRFLETNNNLDAVISMQKTEKFHPDWMFDVNYDELPRLKEAHFRRQELKPKMIHDGHTLIFRTEKFLKKYRRRDPCESSYRYASFGERIKPLIHEEIIVDIDTARDLMIAESFLAFNMATRDKNETG